MGEVSKGINRNSTFESTTCIKSLPKCVFLFSFFLFFFFLKVISVAIENLFKWKNVKAQYSTKEIDTKGEIEKKKRQSQKDDLFFMSENSALEIREMTILRIFLLSLKNIVTIYLYAIQIIDDQEIYPYIFQRVSRYLYKYKRMKDIITFNRRVFN